MNYLSYIQIDDDKDTSKTDRSDTSFNSSSASEFHSQDEYVVKSRSFTCSEVEHKCLQPKRKPRRLSRKVRNAKMSKKILKQIRDLSSDQNTEKTDISNVCNDNVSVKDTIVTVKEEHIPDADTVNSPQDIAHGNEPETVNVDEENCNPNKDTVIPDGDTVHSPEHIINGNEPETGHGDEHKCAHNKDTVTPDTDTVNADEQSVHGNAQSVTEDNVNVNPDGDTVHANDVGVMDPVKTEVIDPEDVKPNVQECAVHGHSAISHQSGELFSECQIKKEENEEESGLNESSISVKGRLLDEVSGTSFAELVSTAENGKEESVDVDVSFYTNSYQTLKVDDKNTQYSGNNVQIQIMIN